MLSTLLVRRFLTLGAGLVCLRLAFVLVNMMLIWLAIWEGLSASSYAEQTRSILGIDISTGMVEQFNARAATVLRNGQPIMHARVLDVLQNGIGGLEGQTFDVVIVRHPRVHLHLIRLIENTVIYGHPSPSKSFHCSIYSRFVTQPRRQSDYDIASALV
jgi:hypothetical protein